MTIGFGFGGVHGLAISGGSICRARATEQISDIGSFLMSYIITAKENGASLDVTDNIVHRLHRHTSLGHDLWWEKHMRGRLLA